MVHYLPIIYHNTIYLSVSPVRNVLKIVHIISYIITVFLIPEFYEIHLELSC